MNPTYFFGQVLIHFLKFGKTSEERFVRRLRGATKLVPELKAKQMNLHNQDQEDRSKKIISPCSKPCKINPLHSK